MVSVVNYFLENKKIDVRLQKEKFESKVNEFSGIIKKISVRDKFRK